MLSNHNSKLTNQKFMQQHQRFGIRKLTIGVASMILGTTFVLGSQNAKADPDVNAGQGASDQSSQIATNSSPASNQVTLHTSPTSTPANTENGSQTNNGSVTVPISNLNGSGVDPSQIGTNLAGPHSETTLTDVSGNTTLAHGPSQTHQLLFTIDAKRGDNVTITVPSIFTPTPDQIRGIVDVSSTTNADHSTTLTYRMSSTDTSSQTVYIGLTPTTDTWDLLPANTTYSVVVRKNGDEVARVDYHYGEPAEITDAPIRLDPHQAANGNLVQGQKYAVALKLPNTGVNDGDNFRGTATITVPAGFQLDSNGAYGFVDDGNYGNVDTTAVEGLTISQAGGAGTPIIINFDNSKQQLNSQNIVFWGTYTQPLTASQNNFQATVQYQTHHGSQLESATHNYAGRVQAMNLPVSNVQQSKLDVVTVMDSKIATDNATDPNGNHQSDDTDNWNYPTAWVLQLNNTGNVAQTNVKLNIQVEPGTIFNYRSIPFVTTGENEGVTVDATLTDGTVLHILPHHNAGANSNGDSASLNSDATATDGSNIRSLQITLDKINPGSSVYINLTKVGAILSKATTKKVNDHAHYSYSLTSDQNVITNGSEDPVIVAPTPKEHNVQFVGNSTGFINGSYDKDSTGSTALMNSGHIYYTLGHNQEKDDRKSSYLIVIPAGFHVESDDDVNVFYNGQNIRNATGAKTAKVTPLGAIGPAGEYVYRVDLSFTPGESPTAIVEKSDNEQLPLVINDGQGPASYNYTQHSGLMNGNGFSSGYPDHIGLLMEINSNNDLVPFLGGQVTSLKPSSHETPITLGGISYNVMPENILAHQIIGTWDYTDAQYSFVEPNVYGSRSGVRNDAEASYHNPNSLTKAEFEYSDHANGVPNVNETTGHLNLTTLLTDGGTSSYSYNVINLPATTNGDPVTFSLTGPGTIVGNGSTSQLLYSTTPLTKTSNLTAADLSNYVPASSITDWSSVRSVLLQSGTLNNNSVVNAYLPFRVAGMQAGLRETSSAADLGLQNIFTGDHTSTVLNSGLMPLPIHVTRYVTVTTHWLRQNDDGTTTDIQSANTQNYKAGDAYTTSALPADQVPTGYSLVATPDNASGNTDASDIVVNYVYAKTPTPTEQQATLRFVDDDDTDTTNNLHPIMDASGNEASSINFAGLNSAVQDLENHGYALVSVDSDGPTASTLSGNARVNFATIFGNFDNDSSTNQAFSLHFVHKTDQATTTATAQRIIHYVENSRTGADLQSPTTQTANFSTNYHYDATKHDATKPHTSANDAVNSQREMDVFTGNPTNVLAPGTPSLTWTTSDSFAQLTGPATFAGTNGTWEFTNTDPAGLTRTIAAETPTAPSSTPENVYLIYTFHANNTPTPTREAKTITETIHYVYATGGPAAPDHVSHVTFNPVGTDGWNLTSNSFAAVPTPTINGYTPDQFVIAAQPVNPTSNDLVFTVTYTANNTPTPIPQPSNQTNATEPVNPTNPTQVTEPVNPTNPTQVTTPVTPTQPTQVTTPIKPTNPTQPSQVTTPVQPTNINVQPVEPVNGQQPLLPLGSTTLNRQGGQPMQQVGKKLPQTGNGQKDASAAVGLGLAALLSALGIEFRKKKEID